MQDSQPYINNIPYDSYITIMNKRKYDIKRIRDYTLHIYNIEICLNQFKNYSQNINNLFWGDNIYEANLLTDLKLQADDKSRTYFNAYIKPRYIKFTNQHFNPLHKEKLDDLLLQKPTKAYVIHHIHPLIFGGDNSFYNLIPLTEYNHKLMHMNPHENYKRKCYQAVDYLSYLYLPHTIKILHKKYFTKKIKMHGFRFNNLFWKIIYEEEMQKFYQNLS